MDNPTESMETTDIKLAFKCPGCLRKLEAELDTVDIAMSVEPCEEHGEHLIISLIFDCPNCNTEIHADMVGS